MLTSKAKSFAKDTGKLALAATVAALGMAAGPIAGAAAAGYPISAARDGPASVQRLGRRVGLCVSGLHGPTWPSRVIGRARRWIDRKAIPRQRRTATMAAYRYSNREHLIITDHIDRAELAS